MTPITDYPYNDSLMSDPKWFWNRRTPEELNRPYNKEDHEALLSIAQNNKRLFQLIMTTIPTLDGWTSSEKSCVLCALVLAMKPKLSVEIGVWAGRSLLSMAWAVQEIKCGTVIGIDAYDATVSADKEFISNAEWWQQQPHSDIEKKCRFLLNHYKLGDTVKLIVKKSDDVEPPPVINLWHCDGSHTEQCITDVERYAKNIPVGGIAILDDLHWILGGCLRGAEKIEEMGFRECYRLVKNANGESNDWVIFQRVK